MKTRYKMEPPRLAAPYKGKTIKGPKKHTTPVHELYEKVQSLRIFKNLYAPVVFATFFLVIYGFVVLISAAASIENASPLRQLLGILVGLVGMVVIERFDYRTFADMTLVLFFANIVLFALPLIPGLGYTAKGMTGWVQIPGINFRFQPSEVMKLVTIYYMAGLCFKYQGHIERFRDYVQLCLLLAIPFLLLLTQDLGTSLIVLVAGATIIVVSGAKKEWVIPTVILLVLLVALVIITSLIPGLPHILKDYQLKRLTVFVDPSSDSTGDAYNLNQAQIAVGSGGLLGKGFGQGTQASEGFLPEAQTDFIFALLAEEFGFIGSILLLALFTLLIVSTIMLAKKTENWFGKLILVGVAAMWLFQVFENIGMCIGIMPITGIPLPFISFGSSSMVVQLIAVGMVQSVYRHRVKAG